MGTAPTTRHIMKKVSTLMTRLGDFIGHIPAVALSLSLMLGTALVSCGDGAAGSPSDPEEPVEEPEGPTGNGEIEKMTPEESKEYLSNTATEALDLFKTADQKPMIDLAAYFMDTFEDFDFPEFDFESSDRSYASPSKYIKLLGRAANGDIDALTRATYTYVYNVNFDKIAGIYEPNKSREEWVKTGNSSDIIVKFTDKNGTACSLTVTKSGSNSNLDYEETDSWYGTTEIYQYHVAVPQTVNAVLKCGNTELAKSTVTSSIDINGHTCSIDGTATMCNLKCEFTLRGNDSNVTADAKVYVGTQLLATGHATVNGHNLCNKSFYENANDDIDPYSLFTNGSCSADVLGKVQAYGQIKCNKGFFEALDEDNYWDSYEYTNKTEAQQKCQAACDVLNSCISTQLRYDGTATDQATIKFVPDYYSSSYYYTYWEYCIGAVLEFPDGTTTSIDKYFEKFTNVSNKFDIVADAYGQAWENAF